jgi:hypothetical protein
MDDKDKPVVEFFYADPVDEHGKVIGTAWMGPLKTPWGEVTGVKVPHDEIVLDPETTIRVRAKDFPDR